jgi:FolB domain-containing protein
MIIKIKNLHLRTFIGFQEWEREKKQDILVNLEMLIPDETAVDTDNVSDSADYKKIKYAIVDSVESSSFYLLERLAGHILDIVMTNKKVLRATVELDKPHALRFADSVSIILSREQK